MTKKLAFSLFTVLIFIFSSCSVKSDITGIWKYREVTVDGVYYSFLILNEDGSLEDIYMYRGYQDDYIGTYTYDDKSILKMNALDKTLVMKVTLVSESMILEDQYSSNVYKYIKSSANEYKEFLYKSENGLEFE